jgi:uncharacterized protein
VLNVVDFGAFVDIGLRDSGLVHVSQLANRYIRDPHEVAAVGDIVKVWVLEIDKTRRRVSLTMIPPGSKRQEAGGRSHGGRSQGEKPDGPRIGGPHTDGQQGGQRPPRRGARPARPSGAPAGEPAMAGGAIAAGSVSTEGSTSTAAATSDAPSPGSIAARSGSGSPPRPPHGKRPYGPPQGRPSRGSDRASDRGSDQGKPAFRPPPKPKPKPLIPITDAMKKGKEPLRTFGDLKQFFEIKTETPPETPDGEEKKADA